jgi:hypothetical protein
MELQPGDLVKTTTGKVGRVISTFRMTAFVSFPRFGSDDYVSGYLASELRKIVEHTATVSPESDIDLAGRFHLTEYAVD